MNAHTTASDLMLSIVDGSIEIPGDDDADFWGSLADRVEIDIEEEEHWEDCWSYRAETHYTRDCGKTVTAVATFGDFRVELSSTYNNRGEEYDCSSQHSGPESDGDRLNPIYDFMHDLAREEMD